jgi:hypothetical protein
MEEVMDAWRHLIAADVLQVGSDLAYGTLIMD